MKKFTNYLKTLAAVNGLDHPSLEWLFYPGMLQDSRHMWWADFGSRRTLHEGLDICFYRSGRTISALAPGARVPALADGSILNISRDLLGHSLAVSLGPGSHETAGITPVMVYSHLDPLPQLAPGDRIKKGEILAKIFDARTVKSRLRSHLHLSCLLIPGSVNRTCLNWSLFADRSRVDYINPVFI